MVIKAETSIVSWDVLNRVINYGARLLGYQNQLDVRVLYTALREAMLALAGSCFPGLEDDISEFDTLAEQRKIKKK